MNNNNNNNNIIIIIIINNNNNNNNNNNQHRDHHLYLEGWSFNVVFAARIFATLWRAAADSEADFAADFCRVSTPGSSVKKWGCLKVSSLEMVGLDECFLKWRYPQNTQNLSFLYSRKAHGCWVPPF